MSEHGVGTVGNIPEGERIIVDIDGEEVGVFNVGGEYYAYANECPNNGGPVCEGRISGTQEVHYDAETGQTEYRYVREGEIISCPWNGWEFDLLTGQCLSNDAYELRSYPVSVENDELIVEVE